MKLQPGQGVDIIGLDCAVWSDERLARFSIASLGVSWKWAGCVAVEKLLDLRDSGEYAFPHALLRLNIIFSQSRPVASDLPDLNNPSSTRSA